jgi:acyl carrier protein
LRRYLRQTLPDYMIPSVFVRLDEMPLTPNGKIDRGALPAPEQERPALEETFVAPRDPVEQELSRLWGLALGLEHVGVHDDFFDLGGHSLLATQVISQIRQAFQVDLSLQAFFVEPTISSLAVTVAHGQAERSSPIQRIDRSSGALLDQLDQLSDQGVDELLSSLLAQKEHQA